MPLVVPQLKTITLGGAVTGLGIESSSFRNGLPHESVREIEILTGAGEVVVARADNEHADLFRAFPNSYGTLGYALRLEIELEPVHRFVQLRHVRFHDLDTLVAAHRTTWCARAATRASRWTSSTARSSPRTESYLTLGTWADEAPYGQRLHRPGDLLPLDPAPAGRLPDRPRLPLALGHRLVLVLAGVRRAEPAHPAAVAPALPAQRRLLADDPVREPHHVAARWDQRRGRPRASGWCRTSRSRSSAPRTSCGWFLSEVPIEPIWLCPLALR